MVCTFSDNTQPASLPADVRWGSFVTHSRNECVTNEPQRTSAGRLATCRVKSVVGFWVFLQRQSKFGAGLGAYKVFTLCVLSNGTICSLMFCCVMLSFHVLLVMFLPSYSQDRSRVPHKILLMN